jgi:hypothetical protein
VELLEGGAGSLEVGEFHLRIFTGEDDAVGVALEGGEDGIADAVGRALAVGGLGGDVDVDAGPEQGVGAAQAGELTLNVLFVRCFQSLAEGHFTIRRLERKYGAKLVREEYERVRNLRLS